MGDTENTKKAPKKSFWKGLKAEYKRIIWPDKETVTKQTGAVIAVSVALGLIIAALDTAIVFEQTEKDQTLILYRHHVNFRQKRLSLNFYSLRFLVFVA